MLTRDLLRYRAHKGAVRPRFIDLQDVPLQCVADGLVACAAASLGQSRGAVQDALAEHTHLTVHPQIQRGLVKLVLDRCEFAEPDDSPIEARIGLFAHSTALLRDIPDGATLKAYVQQLQAVFGPLGDIYGDLPDNRLLSGFKPCTGRELLARYNLAQVQGLVMGCRALHVETRSHDVLALRRVLRWLKFCRLVCEIEREGDLWTLHITGPAALFAEAKKYSLQLASFVAVVPLLSNFCLRADVSLRPGVQWNLNLTHDDGLRSPHGRNLGHIPPEVTHVAQTFASDAWQLDLAVEPRHVGPTGMMVPDLTFRHQTVGEMHVELFHRWHQHALSARLEQLTSRPDPHVVLGIERALHKNDTTQSRLAEYPHVPVFCFSAFPAARHLRQALADFSERMSLCPPTPMC